MKLDIVGVGSALVDVTVHVADAFLEQENLPKGGMTLVDADRSRQLRSQFDLDSLSLCPGGAAANVMATYALCGGKAGFLGKIGRDNSGDLFHQGTVNAGVHFMPLFSATEHTGVVLSLITPDGQRTFATHLGAAVGLGAQDLATLEAIEAPWLFLEAYLLFNQELMEALLTMAHAHHQKVAMDLASFTVVEQNREYLNYLLESGKLTAVFANEEESQALTGQSPRQTVAALSRFCPIVVIKEGGQGSWIATKGQVHQIPAEKTEAVDTNGAGDAYAGGVLFGIGRGLTVDQYGGLGAHIGRLVVSQMGARLNPENITHLDQRLASLGLDKR